MSFLRFTQSGLLLALLFVSPGAQADVKDISVGVNGVTCPVCTHSLNIGLRRLPGVKSVKVSLATRVRLDVTVHPGAWIDPAQIFQQIRVLGYTPRQDEVKFRLVGDVTTNRAQLVLTLSDVVAPHPVRFVLEPAEVSGKQGDAIRQAIDRLRKSLETNANSQRVEVEGWWHPEQGPLVPASLLITELHPAG